MKSSAALPGELVDADERRMVILHFQKYGFAADEPARQRPLERLAVPQDCNRQLGSGLAGDVVDRRVVGIGRHL